MSKPDTERDELREVVRDGLSNHSGEFLNPWLIKGSWTHEQLSQVLEAVMSSDRLFKNIQAHYARQEVDNEKKPTQSMQMDTQSGSTQISNTQSQMHLYKILEEMLLVSTQYDWINNDSDLKFVVQKFGVEKILQAQLTSQAEQEKLLMEEE